MWPLIRDSAIAQKAQCAVVLVARDREGRSAFSAKPEARRPKLGVWKRAFLLFLHFSLPYPPPLPPLFSTFWGGEVDLLIASKSPHARDSFARGQRRRTWRQRARSCARQKELTNSMGRACVVLTSANRESDTQGVCRDGGSSVIHSDNSTRALISRVHVVGIFRFL